MEQIEGATGMLKGWRKALACLMAVVLCLGLMPSPALAAETTAAGTGTQLGAATVQINATSLEQATVTLSKSSYNWDGKAKQPKVTVKVAGKALKSGTDYTVAYKNNKKAGTASVVITGKGSYTGTATKAFKINPKSLSKAKVTLKKTSYTYDGKAKKPAVTVKLAGKKLAKANYTLVYKKNIKAGTATVTVKGKGNYKGAVTKKFKIAKRSLAKASVKLAKSTYAYSGKALKPSATVKVSGKKLKAGTDYTIVYKNNKKIGTATATIKGKGSYKGSVSKTFKIVDPLIGKWRATAMSARESGGRLVAVPAGSNITLNAKSSKGFTIKLGGKNYSGKWAYDTSKNGTRYYDFYFNTKEHWYGGLYSDGDLVMMDVYDHDYSLIFE